MEDVLKINKTATVLLISVILWMVYTLTAEQFVLLYNADAFREFIEHNNLSSLSFSEQVKKFVVEFSLFEHVSEAAELVIYLIGGMTIVELIDKHGGFNPISNRIKTRKNLYLLWIIAAVSFCLGAVIDNLTTAIVMIVVLRKIIPQRKIRWMYCGIVVLASNAGGAFSPIGDVTTVMLWLKGNITTIPTMTDLFLPSLVSVLVPLIIVSFMIKGELKINPTRVKKDEMVYPTITRIEKITIFCLGVGGFICVPIFREVTGLPPFVGVLGALAILWIYTEVLYRNRRRMDESIKQRVSKVLKDIDMPTVLFIFGVIMSVAVLQESGVLKYLADCSIKYIPDVYLINGIVGILSAVVDNVPFVAAAMGMYPIADAAMISAAVDPTFMAHFAVDGAFWQLLAYCSGVGGSILIIGSAAGLVLMGIEKMTFYWYLKKITWLALVGYFAGIGMYYLQTVI
jgi:Na+/H+ antiporter NhaD/arsenite permease-like protein